MPAPTEFGSAGSSRGRASLWREIILANAMGAVQYFTMQPRVAEGSFLALENVGVRQIEHELDTS